MQLLSLSQLPRSARAGDRCMVDPCLGYGEARL
jgi:hypothetical protein